MKKIAITMSDYDMIYKEKSKDNDFFVGIVAVGGNQAQLLLFDSLKEAREYTDKTNNEGAFKIILNL